MWAATEPRSPNQAYNVSNGDYFRWRNAWPKSAAWDVMSDVIESRLRGFHDVIHSEAMFRAPAVPLPPRKVVP